MKKGIVFILCMLVLVAYAVADTCTPYAPPSYVYQEDANSTSIDTSVFITGDLELNYSKLPNAAAFIWQVKHGNNTPNLYNITISPKNNSLCWNSYNDKVRVLLRSYNSVTSSPYCWNGAAFTPVGTSDSSGGGGTVTGLSNQEFRMYDGDWDTEATWFSGNRWDTWASGPAISGVIYEDAGFWKIVEDWNVDCSDNCVINSDVNLPDTTLNLYGTGTFNILADVLVDKVEKINTCQIANKVGDGNRLIIKLG